MADSYAVIADMAADDQWLERLRACAGQQGITDPYYWVVVNRYQLSAAPGFAEAYAYAVATNVENPGRDESVISDAMLLAQVQTVAGGA